MADAQLLPRNASNFRQIWHYFVDFEKTPLANAANSLSNRFSSTVFGSKCGKLQQIILARTAPHARVRARKNMHPWSGTTRILPTGQSGQPPRRPSSKRLLRETGSHAWERTMRSHVDAVEPEWIPITYGGYWDMPRSFIFEHDSRAFVLLSPWQDEIDDYSPTFLVFEVWRGMLNEPKWFFHWQRFIIRRFADVPCSRRLFDPSGRSFFKRAAIAKIVETFVHA